MKENIYTIPVIEAFENGGECALCQMHESLTTNAIDFMLGEAYMDDLIRMETNKTGFCKTHLTMLYDRQNRLGLSLIMQSHMSDVFFDMREMLESSGSEKPVFFKKAHETSAQKIVKYVRRLEHTCYLCNRINDFFNRYVDTIFYLWNKENDIKDIIKKSNGFCLNHYATLLETGEKKLSTSQFHEFVGLTTPLMLKSLSVLEEDLDWFVKKYDYRFAKEPWKNSRDSLQRALKKMQSINVKEE